MTKAKILIIDKCWDCKWFTCEGYGPSLCWEPTRGGGGIFIPDSQIIDPGCLLQDAPKPITELISEKELENILNNADKGGVESLEDRIQLALDLAAGYDGMDTPEGLKSLIDDMVKALKGEMKYSQLF